MLKGKCLCGAVAFTVTAPQRRAAVCHCGQCRKQSGHVWASDTALATDIEITGTPTWFASSATAKRGFCGTCGSFLFWKAHDEDTMSFSLGALEAPTGLSLTRHIFTADKGDYYTISDDLPQS